MAHTVVGLFSTTARAQEVKQTLVGQGIQANNIHIVAEDDDTSYGNTTGTAVASGEDYRDKATDYGVTDEGYDRSNSGKGEGIGQKISNFFSSLTGGDDQTHEHYASGVNEGGALLAVRVNDETEADRISSLLRQHGARDIEDDGGDDRNALSGSTPGYAADANRGTTGQVLGEQSIPVVEEELQVGKREVSRGGVRVYSHIVETPVDESITLRDERINVERRPANRPATAADFQTGSRGTFEMNATGEEAVVGKTARVVEEVLIGKESSSRTENIHDSVRKTEVEVEQVAGNNDAIPARSTNDR